MIIYTVLRFLVACLCCATITTSQVLGSHQLAAGEWKVQLRGRFLDPNAIFPKTESNLPSEIVPRRGLWGTKVLDCVCSLSDDGSFCLRPEKNSDNHLAVRGRWKVLSNPYCITDRFYDELTLKSYPRQHIVKGHGGCETINDNTTAVNVHARLWGRYSRNKSGRGRGKLSHGSLTITSEKTNQQRLWWIPRQAIAFSAERTLARSTEEDWEDKKYFGY